MTNVQKALEIAKKHCINFGFGINDDDSIQCYNSAMEMAEWKEKEVLSRLKEFMKHHFEENITPLGKNVETLHFDTIEDVVNEFYKCLKIKT